MRRYWIWLLPLTVAAAIVWLSSQPSYPFDLPLPEPMDKVAHMAAFGVLAAFAELALRRSHPGLPVLRWLIVLFIGVAIFGATDELHQRFVPGRSCDFYDWVADALGGGLGLVLAAWPRFRKQNAG